MKAVAQPRTLWCHGPSALAVTLALVCMLLAVGQRWAARMPGEGGWAAFVVPVAPGREIDVNIWNREKVYIDKSYNHSASTTLNGVTLGVWYQDTSLAHMRQLVVTPLPEWPLLAMAATLVGFTAWRLRQLLAGPGLFRRLINRLREATR